MLRRRRLIGLKKEKNVIGRSNSRSPSFYIFQTFSPNERKEKEIPGVQIFEKAFRAQDERRNFPFPWTLLRALINQQ